MAMTAAFWLLWVFQNSTTAIAMTTFNTSDSTPIAKTA
jgi:hypothetical protein